MTWKAYFHSLIHTQPRLSNLSADRLFIEAWDLSPLSIIVVGEVEKPVRRNRILHLMKNVRFFIGKSRYWLDDKSQKQADQWQPGLTDVRLESLVMII